MKKEESPENRFVEPVLYSDGYASRKSYSYISTAIIVKTGSEIQPYSMKLPIYALPVRVSLRNYLP